ncbi:MAG TPA: choice-of-anchor V domain-containing protein [Candidatus Acidoferrales bacterium]|nr:choice-of-anchor V domain-containing protein [Candidatus Acidoferrales bacterium]
MQRARKLFLAKVAVAGVAVPILLWAYEYGPDPGHCGVPGEGASCIASGCHTGTANSSANKGSVSVTFPGGQTYIPGVKQHLKVIIADTAASIGAWGFQLTTRPSSSSSTMAGSFAFTDVNTLLMCSQTNLQVFQAQCQGKQDGCTNSNTTCPSNMPLQYIEHSLSGYNNTKGTGSGTYEFDWTPPSTNVGNVVLYVAGNAGLSGLPTQNGDHIYTTTYTLTPTTAAQPSVNNVLSASAFGGYTSVAPGSWMEIYGSGLSNTTRQWGGNDFQGTKAPTSLDNVSVTIGGQPAFVYYVSPTQINAQAPSNVSAGSQPVVVTNGSSSSPSQPITVNALQPGMEAVAPAFVVSGKQYVVALFPDSTLNGPFVLPPNAVPGVASRYAKPGDSIIIYGVGFGPAQDSSGNAIPAGTVVTATNKLTNSFSISIGGSPATVQYQGLAPSFVGLYQFNVVVPNIANNDFAPVTYTLNGTAGPQTLYLAVHN